MPLQIRDYDTVYETSSTRRYQRISYIHVPNKAGVGFTLLTSEPDGWALYGVYQRLVCWISTRSRREGGWLTYDGTPDTQTMPVELLAKMATVPEDLLRRLLEVATRSEIAWIVETSTSNGECTVSAPCDNGESTVHSPGLHRMDRIGLDKDRRGEESTIARTRVDSESTSLLEPEAYQFTVTICNAWLEDSYQRRARAIAEEAKKAGKKPPGGAYQVRDSKAKRAIWNARLRDGFSVDDIRAALFGNAIDVWHLARSKHDWPYVLQDTAKGDKLERFAQMARLSGYDNLKTQWEDDNEQDEDDEEGEGGDGREVEHAGDVDADVSPGDAGGRGECTWTRIQREIRERELARKSKGAGGGSAAE